MGTTFLVDDTNPSIVYDGSGTWDESRQSISGITNEYNSTFHSATTAGLTIKYKFNGTGITAFCTIDTPGANGFPDSTYSLDNMAPVAFNSTGVVSSLNPDVVSSHVAVFSVTNLSVSEEHTLIITTTDASSSKRYIFDYFAVETTVEASSSSAVATAAAQLAGRGDVAIMVDNADSRFVYRVNDDTLAWSTTGSLTTGRTAHIPPVSTNTPDGVAIVFFNGTAVEVIGRVTYADATSVPSSPLLRLSLYRGSGTSQEGTPILFTPSVTAQHPVQEPMYVSFGNFSGLSGGEYRLHIENTNTNEGVAWDLARFQYKPHYRALISEGGGGTTSATNSNGLPVPNFTQTQSHSQSNGTESSPTPAKVSKAVIAGAVIGAVAGVVILITLIWFFRRHCRCYAGEIPEALQIDPYTTGEIPEMPQTVPYRIGALDSRIAVDSPRPRINPPGPIIDAQDRNLGRINDTTGGSQRNRDDESSLSIPPPYISSPNSEAA